MRLVNLLEYESRAREVAEGSTLDYLTGSRLVLEEVDESHGGTIGLEALCRQTWPTPMMHRPDAT